MTIVYTNHQYLPYHQATVHIEDRGYQFADGVYEVIYFKDRQLIDGQQHFERLERSMRELRLPPPMSTQAIEHIVWQVIKRNRIKSGSVYLQVTRGTAPRDFPFPKNAKSTLTVVARRTKPPAQKLVEHGVKVITVPDQRWARCDIKSIALLPATLAKQAAKDAEAFEAWQVDGDGYVTEGSSTNAFIIKDNQLITRPPSAAILKGVTRTTLLKLAGKAGLSYTEKPFTVAEAYQADEAFLSSTTTFLLPIIQIDNQQIGVGMPGELSLKLRRLYEDYI